MHTAQSSASPFTRDSAFAVAAAVGGSSSAALVGSAKAPRTRSGESHAWRSRVSSASACM